MTNKGTFKNIDVGVEKANDSTYRRFVASWMVFSSSILKKLEAGLIDLSVDRPLNKIFIIQCPDVSVGMLLTQKEDY